VLRKTAGILLCLAGAVAGVWFGVVWGLVGGIILAVHAFEASPVNAGDATWGIVRAVLCELIGLGAFLVLFLPGAWMFDN
jgi:hypothetical protein